MKLKLPGLILGALFFLVSCATTRTTPYRNSFLPPAPQAVPPHAFIEPRFEPQLYAASTPHIVLKSMPPVPRATEADFRLQRAEQRFQAGRIAYQQGRLEDARREFDLAVDALLTAPSSLPERARLERRLEQIVEAIYQMDLSLASAAAESEDKVAFDQSPLDELLELTFPVDPNLKGKVSREVRSTASQLPLEENDTVLAYVNFFSSERGRRRILYGLQRSGKYRDMILRVLAEEGVPQELIFLAQAESAFLPRAVSYRAAAGMWQFVRDRGREYGLSQTPFADERLDPEKATRAAARHLRDLFHQFGDWYLAMAAYNCGPGCVDRAVARTGYADFWTLARMGALPRETQNYVPLILAMTIVAKNAKDYGLEDLKFDPPLEYETVELESPTNLALVADATGATVEQLRELNPALLKSIAPAGYSLHVPVGASEPLAAVLNRIPSANRGSWRAHRVSSGETLMMVAKRYGAAPASIASANPGAEFSDGDWVAIPAAMKAEPPQRPTAPRKFARNRAPARSSTIARNSKAASGKAAARRDVQLASARKSVPVRPAAVRPANRSVKGKPVLTAGLR
jgi:membrane-bound lytic murein transglycosylase D